MTVFSIVLAAIILITLMALPAVLAIGTGLDVDSYRITMNRTPTQLSGLSLHNVTTGPAATARGSVGASPVLGKDFMSSAKVPTTPNQRQIVDNHDVQKTMLAVCMREAGILSCAVNVTNANIQITIQRTGDNDTFHKALESIIVNYAWFAVKSTYNGDLRIILDNSQGKMIDEWNTTASDAMAHVQDKTVGTGWVESVINASRDVKAITFGLENVLSGTGVASARGYSVSAGGWNVSFNTSTPVHTNCVWSELQGLNNNGYFCIWINTSYQVSGISLFEQPKGVRAPVTSDYLETYLKPLIKDLSSPIITDYKIDGKDGLVAHGWSNKVSTITYAACYPVDPEPNNTATMLVDYLSYIGEKPSMDIINSLHIERANPQTTSSQPAQATPTSYTPQATGTRDDPVPIGTAVNLGDGWIIQVLNIYPDATNMVLQKNQFNKAPKPGDQFFLATVQVKYVGEGSSTFSSYDLRAVGPSSVGYSTFQNSAGVIPDPLPSSEVFTGGTVTGNVGWEISSSDANGLVMYDIPLFGGNPQGRVYMALYGPGSSSLATSYFGNEDWAYKGTGKMGRGY